MLFDRHPDTFALSVSHTTRAPRPGEVDGVHYHFVSMEAFEDLIAKDGFVENAKYGRNRYGTSKMTIEEQTKKGKVVVLDIEMEVRHLCTQQQKTHVSCTRHDPMTSPREPLCPISQISPPSKLQSISAAAEETDRACGK
jgi:guanylate kinase